MHEHEFDILIPVTFRDLDAFGHVNNAVYATYLENARLAYFAQLLTMPVLPPHLVKAMDGPGAGEPSLILADLAIAYRSPAMMGETVRVQVWVSRLGTKSFDMSYRLLEAASGRLIAEAKTVLVAFDYAQNRSVPLPQRWREAMTPSDDVNLSGSENR